jgi:signal transduction histidine kinase
MANAAENVALSFAVFFKEVMKHAAVLEKEIGNQALEQFHLSRIQDSCVFGVNLIYRLMVLYGKIPVKREQFDLNDIMRSIDPFVFQINRDDILFEIDMADEELPMMGDTQLIKQVIAELLLNASDALPSGGIITLATRKVKMAKNSTVHDACGENGGCALLSVVDTGKGMNDETGRKIFRTFFTTKPIGTGAGLGLPLVDYVVRAHNGSMKIMSRIGEGTSIRVYLPLMKSEARTRGRDISRNS